MVQLRRPYSTFWTATFQSLDKSKIDEAQIGFLLFNSLRSLLLFSVKIIIIFFIMVGSCSNGCCINL